MELYQYSPSVTFVVLTADQFVGRDDHPFEEAEAGYATFVEKKNRTGESIYLSLFVHSLV